MTGALALLAGAGLLATGSLRLASRLASRSTATFLLGAYIVAWGQLVLVLWALSLLGQVSRWPLLAALAVVCAALVADTRGRSDVLARLRDAARELGRALRDPVCAVLAAAAAAALAYALALGLATPQNDFDTLIDHLWRAALWHQNRAAGYPDCACAPYINAYPPHGELGVLATMTLGGVDRYVTLVQAFAYVALPVGIVGVARGLGLSRRESLVGGLLVATLPVIALQASTAQNDLVVASFFVAAAALLLDRGWASPWLAAAATALAVGTKVTAVIGIPLLVAVALAAPLARARGRRLLAVVGGAALGSYWYAVNWWQTGSWDGGFPYETLERDVAATVARVLRSSVQFVELPGGVGRDRWLVVVAAALVAVGLVLRGRTRVAALAALLASAPVVTLEVRRYVDEAYVELWQALGRDDLAAEVGRDITRSAANVTWCGPLGALMLVTGLVVTLVTVRRGRLPRVAALLALAPLYWLVALSALLFYQDAAGRFFMAPMAVAAASWGLVARRRWAAWGLTSIAVTALALAVLNDTKRPSGLALLERPAPPSYFAEPRWRAQGKEVFVPELIRLVDERVPAGARIGLAITPSDPGYVVLGRGLRRFELFPSGRSDAPGASWVFASASARSPGRPKLCAAWSTLAAEPDGWTVYRRVAPRC